MKHRRSDFALLALVFVVALPVAPASAARKPPARPVPGAPRLQPVTPQSAVRCLAQSYQDRSLEQFASLLAADYRFHFSAGDSAGRGYLEGMDRDHEILANRRLFGGERDGTVDLPEITNLAVSIGGLDESADPEHPDSLAQYRVVVARRFGIKLEFAKEEGSEKVEVGDASTHVFYLVRGDVARLADGQSALSDRWYIRRWMEDIDALAGALGGQDGHCDESAPDAPPAGMFGVRPVGSPLCATLEVVCDLPTADPATLEVFDLQGRRVAKQLMRPDAPGPVRIAAGSGNRFAPGAYWLRLTQGHRPPSKRLVVVAR